MNAIRTRRGYILDEKPGATKRSRDSSDHDLKPLRNGQRPVVSGDEAAKGEIGETSGGSDDEIMTYRRADGRLVAKQRVSVHSKGKEVNIPRDVDLLSRRPEVCAVAE